MANISVVTGPWVRPRSTKNCAYLSSTARSICSSPLTGWGASHCAKLLHAKKVRLRLPADNRGRVDEPERCSSISGVGRLITAQPAHEPGPQGYRDALPVDGLRTSGGAVVQGGQLPAQLTEARDVGRASALPRGRRERPGCPG